MRSILLLACSLLLLTTGTFAGNKNTNPNVILILIDDLGWKDLGCMGSTYYETPNIDALAKKGVLFTNAYAANPVCSPTRASILTGKYPSRIGITNHSGSPGPVGENYHLTPPELVGNMPLEDHTLAEELKETGYVTAHIGKWHLAKHTETDRRNYPENNGFDINIAGHKMGQPGSYYFPYKSEQHPGTNVPDMEDGKEGDYLTDAFTDRAIDFIQSNQGRPFFLNMWYHTVHTPIQPRQDKLAKYQQKARGLGLDKTADEAVQEYQSWSHAHQDNADYACMVESMDENIGRIMKTLKRLNLEKETIVVFFSDNGGLSTGKGPKSPTSNFPLRAGKAWVYEGGIREPLIIKWSGIAEKGSQIHEPVISTDLYPTILDMIGISLRPQQHMDGISLKPLIAGESGHLEREAIYFHYPHYHHVNTMGPAGALRMGDYKLVERFENMKVELFNLKNDIGETKDLSDEMPELTEKMKLMLHQWREATGSRMPEVNKDFKLK
jgi:arylsulfatase A-like enzyme